MRNIILMVSFIVPCLSFSQNIDITGLWYIGIKDAKNDLEIARKYILYPDTSNHRSVEDNMWIMEKLTFNEDSTFTLNAMGTPQNPFDNFPTLEYYNSGRWIKLSENKVALIVKNGVYNHNKYTYFLSYDDEKRLVFTLIDEELIEK